LPCPFFLPHKQCVYGSQENCVKLELNRLARESARKPGAFHDLRIEVLDIEVLTGTRPETFVHENTNHFYCQCKDTGTKQRCFTDECLLKRTDRYENGEANRVLAQLVLGVLDGDGDG
jgi:hypothetical protein